MTDKRQLPVACSLSSTEARTRQAEWDELLSRAALRRTAVAGGLRVEFSPDSDVRGELTRLVELERECCPFLELTIEQTAEGLLALTATAPHEAAPLVEDLFA